MCGMQEEVRDCYYCLGGGSAKELLKCLEGGVCALYMHLDNVTHCLLDLNSLSGPECISYSTLTGMEIC